MTGETDKTPLIVDLDGTLIRSDLLMECFWRGMGTAPVATLRTSFARLRQRPALKAELADIATPELSRVPINDAVAAAIEAARTAGRPVYLISGSTARLVRAMGDLHGPFDGMEGSSGIVNLTSTRKRDWLVERFGESGFDYIGDSRADIPVWKVARRALVAQAAPRFLALLQARGLSVEPVGPGWRWQALLQAMRPHQWLKNVLLFLPLLAAHRFDIPGIGAAMLGAIAFSLLASAIYIVNDLTDLDADRLHEKKRFRPFAAGTVPIRVGMAASVALGVAGLAIGTLMSPWLLAVLLVYLVATLSYSIHLKRVRWVDVTMLASLYTLRVVAGAVAAGVATSGWLIGFVFPVFLSLGCVKRLTELSRATDEGFLPGRRYQSRDRDDLLNVAIISGLAALGVFIAYSLSDTGAALYPQHWALWVVAALLGGWLVRMVWTGWTGQQDYDPIIFAFTDRWGVGLMVAAMAVLIFGAL